jgi:hypothetical protein
MTKNNGAIFNMQQRGYFSSINTPLKNSAAQIYNTYLVSNMLKVIRKEF